MAASGGGAAGGAQRIGGGGGGRRRAAARHPAPRGGGGGLAGDSCTRDLQMRAEWAWRGAQMTSQTSVNSLRQLLSALERVRGDKTVILISGGWPLDDREQHTLMSTRRQRSGRGARDACTRCSCPATIGLGEPAHDELHAGQRQLSAVHAARHAWRA